MSVIRDQKRKMRGHLHDKLKVPAYYIIGSEEPKLIHVRVHSKFDATSIDAGTGNGTMLSRQVILPKILFMRAELVEQEILLRKNAIISVEAGVAYRLDNAEPPDDISVSWIVTQRDLRDTVDLPVPADG